MRFAKLLSLGIWPSITFLVFIGSKPVYAQTYTDGTFNNWSSQAFILGSGSSSTFIQNAAAGNPSPSIDVTNVVGTGGAASARAWIAVWDPSNTWDPASQGPIACLSMSVEFKSGAGAMNLGQGVHILAIQNAKYYISNRRIITYTSTSWMKKSFSTGGNGGGDFKEIVNPWSLLTGSQPDLSASGSPITFGIIFENSGTQYSLTNAYDNWTLTAWSTVPVPATEVVRLGTPANPSALLPGVTSGPILGATWDPVIDHSSFLPGAVSDFIFISPFPDNLSVPPFGTVLCSLLPPPIVISNPAGVAFSITVPVKCSLIGQSFCSQGISTDGAAIAFTNALDVTVGTF